MPYDPDIENQTAVSDWKQTNVILKVCGDNVILTESHERNFFYGGTRKKLKYQDGKVVKTALGRAKDADEEQRCKNARRVQGRRNAAIRDLMNCNEYQLQVFETLTGCGNYRDLTQAYHDRRCYFDRLERFIRTGKLYGKRLPTFTPQPDFALVALGVPEFQDGHSNKTGIGTGNVHFHHFINTPYLPQVRVIHAKVTDPKTGERCEAYLCESKGGRFAWSLAAGDSTPWFQTDREALDYLKEHRKALTGDFFNAEPKRLCVDALLWGEGHTKVKKLEDLRKRGKLSNPGEYLCQYMGKDANDDRLRGRRGWYKRGALQRPVVYRDPAYVSQYIKELNLWKFLTHQYEFIAEFMGAMTKYFFNFWVDVYPWIQRLYALKMERKRMETVDWLACGVGADPEPMLC